MEKLLNHSHRLFVAIVRYPYQSAEDVTARIIWKYWQEADGRGAIADHYAVRLAESFEEFAKFD